MSKRRFKQKLADDRSAWRTSHYGFLAAIGVCTVFSPLSSAIGSPRVEGQPVEDAARATCIEQHEQGQVARNAGRMLEAREMNALCQKEECPALLRADCAQWFAEVDRAIPSVVFSVEAAGRDVVDAAVFADEVLVDHPLDGRPHELNPGRHTIRVEIAGLPPVERQIVLIDSEKGRLLAFTLATAHAESVAAVRTSPKENVTMIRPVRPLTWVLAGSAVATALTGGIVGGVALGERAALAKPRAEGGCAPFCSETVVRKVKNEAIAADVLFGVSGAVGVVSLITFLARPSVPFGTKPSPSIKFDAAPLLEGAGIGVKGRF